MSKTNISWAEDVWNPITGCTPVSPGCAHCYAKAMAHRLAGRFGYPKDEPFQVTEHPDKLAEPLRWKKPRRIFVCSMGDLFHKDVQSSFISQVYLTMARCPQHIFMVLTKRPERVKEMTISRPLGWQISALPNVWLGVSTENQATADERIPLLLETPAARRFVSAEPLLGPIELPKGFRPTSFNTLQALTTGLDLIIVGGESGPHFRPIDLAWARSLRDQCQATGTAFYFKQLAGPKPGMYDGAPEDLKVRQWPD